MPKVKRPWMPDHKPFETGRVGQRWPGYKTTQWRNFSRWFKMNHPICAVDGCNRETYYTDHVTPVVQLIALGRDPYDESECQPLCRKCGDQKTGREGRASKG